MTKPQYPPCDGNALGGDGPGGLPLSSRKFSPASPIFNKLLPDQAPYQPLNLCNILTKLIMNCIKMGAGDCG